MGKTYIDLYNIKSVINDSFYPYLTNKDRYLIFYGGAGSGKSKFIAQKILIRILIGMQNKKKLCFLCVRKTQPAVKKSVLKEFLILISEWGLEGLCKVNRTEATITFTGGSSIICIGLDISEKLKSIAGITSVWVEEATELTDEDAMQIDLRLRGQTDTYKQLIYAFNPISKLNWIYKRFFLKEADNVSIMHSTYEDNRFLDDEYIKMLKSLKEQNITKYDVYKRGVWGILEHTIYSNYTIINNLPDKGQVIYGCDFGYNVPTAITKIVQYDDEYYIREELYQTKLTNTDLIERIKQLKINDALLFCDSAEPQRIEELRRAGINARQANKSVKDGIDFIKAQKLYITSDSTNLIKEIQGYTYQKDRNDTVLDIPTKFNDHAVDSFRYGIFTHFGKKIEYKIYTGE